MRRNDFVIKLMSVVLFIAIAAYIGLYIFDKANRSLVTTAAVRYTVEDSGSAEGYIVRSETVLTGGGSAVTLMAGDGDKLASGQAVAVHYGGESALERASEIRALQLEINEAEAAAAVSGDQKDADADIFALSSAIQNKELGNIEDLTLSIKKTIFTSTSEKVTEADLAVLKARLTTLLSQDSDTTTLYSPMSGVFSSVVDGFESVGPESLADLTPASLELLFSQAAGSDGAALGKLVTGITWYYAAVMEAVDALKLEGKATAVLQFTKTYNARLDMKIENIGAEEAGKCVVVFSAKRGVSDMTDLRRLTAQVEFSSVTGLTVPKEAVYQENSETEDKTYIFLLTGLQAEKVYIDILSDIGESYIVKDGAENGTVLREGCEIIVKAEALFDGKVVGR